MTWNKNTEPKSSGWYLCTVSVGNDNRFVMPIYRDEYPKGHFHWGNNSTAKIVACAKFPKPYEGEPR